jgi:hypothetical protein
MSGLIIAAASFFVTGAVLGVAVWACVDIARDLVLDGAEDADDDRDDDAAAVVYQKAKDVSIDLGGMPKARD